MTRLLRANHVVLVLATICLQTGCEPTVQESGSSNAGTSANPVNPQPTGDSDAKPIDPEVDTQTDEVAINKNSGEGPKSTPRDRVPKLEILEITFDDLKCNMQEDIVFRPWMLTDRAKELDGKRIQVAGFMLPHLKREGITEFVLLRNVECKFGPGGKADHLVRVNMQNGATTDYHGDRPLDVVGTLKINPFQGPDGNTWCIYDLEGHSVKWKRR